MAIKAWISAISEWVSRVGIWAVCVAILGWLSKVLWSSFWDRVNRGRALVDQAKPELRPLGWSGFDWRGYVRVKNEGQGIAKHLRLRLSGCSREAPGGEVRPGEEGHTAELAFDEQPFALTRLDEPLSLMIEYSDKYGNGYSLIVPVTQYQRNDGRFNLNTSWGSYEIRNPSLSRLVLWKIGKL